MRTLLTLLALIGFLQIHAQEEEQLPDSLWQMYDLEDVVVTAQYAPTASENAVHEVQVIKAAQIREQGLNTLNEVLQNQLNLRVSTDPILGNGLRIQGIGGENVQIMIDGVPVIGRVGGNIDLSQINLNNVERIEIIEGAMSAQYGSNAAGGVINIITKKSQLKTFSFQSNNQYESIGIWNNSLGAGLQSKSFYAGLNVTRFHSPFAPVDSLRVLKEVTDANGETFTTRKIPWSPKTQIGADATLRYRPSDSLSLTYQYRRFNEKLARYGEIRRPQFRPYAFDDFFYTTRQDHSFTAEAYLGKTFYLKSVTAYNQYDRRNETLRLDIEPDTTSAVAGTADTTTFTALLHRSILSTVAKGRWNAQIGFEALHETGTGERLIDSTSLPVNQAVLSNYAAWLGLRYELTEGLLLSGNLRYGYNSKYNHPLIPAFNLDCKVDENWRIRLGLAYGFRAPTLKELHFNFIDINHFIIGNADLAAETSRNLTMSLSYSTKFGSRERISATIKGFQNTIENRIVLSEFEELKFNYQNLAKYLTHGVNLRFSYSIDDVLNFKSGFSLTRLYNTFSEDFASERYISLPEWQNEISLSESEFSQVRLNLTHRYIGRQERFFTNADGDLEQGFIANYHLVNLSFSREFWENKIFVSAGLKNLTDVQAVAASSGGGTHSTSSNSQLINWGRTWFVRVNVQL